MQVGGPENRPSVLALLVPLMFSLLTSTTPAQGAEAKEGFALLISTCLRETRNACLVTVCVFSVH